MKIKVVEQKVVLFVTIVAFLTFVTLQSNKANSHTSEVEVHTKLKLCHLGHFCAKTKSCSVVKKVLSQLPILECSCGKLFIPFYEFSGDWAGLPSHMNTLKFNQGNWSEVRSR